MVKFAHVAGALALIAAPAIAQTAPAGTPKAQDVQATESSDANRIVCKKEESLGSRLGAKKVCLTVKEWQELASANREHTEDIQKDSGFRASN
ncbi:MAG TPA: hypothetical protein VFU80_00230 [Sphingomicrobium sp.]|nr:hypothetical protein [Sphingomicrobium sp.]